MTILVHGDAAFAGEGVVQETLNLSELAGYRTGGTLHIIINNQVGFTTEPSEGRSTTYATDIAKMLQIPIFHVNGEDPEAVAQVVSLAMDFRKEFHRDVVIDLLEQPMARDALAEMAELQADTDIPIGLDESIRGVADLDRILEHPPLRSVNVKTTKMGLHPAVAVLDRARELGLECMIGCMIETTLNATVSAVLAGR